MVQFSLANVVGLVVEKLDHSKNVEVCNLWSKLYNPFLFGVWRSLAARFVRVEEVAGSSPATPTEGYVQIVRSFFIASHDSMIPDLGLWIADL